MPQLRVLQNGGWSDKWKVIHIGMDSVLMYVISKYVSLGIDTMWLRSDREVLLIFREEIRQQNLSEKQSCEKAHCSTAYNAEINVTKVNNRLRVETHL